MNEAIVVKWHILKLSTYQLQMTIPPSNPSVVPKLIVVWAPVCSKSDQLKEIYQKGHHSLPILRDGNTCSGRQSYPISMWRGWVGFKEVVFLDSQCNGKEWYKNVAIRWI